MSRLLVAGDYIDIGYSAGGDFTSSPLTVSLWINFTTNGNTLSDPFSYVQSAAQGLHLNVVTNGAGPGPTYVWVARLLGYNSGSTLEVNVQGVTQVNDGKWHHICGVYNYSNGGANTLYVDGAQDATGTSAAAWGPPSGGNMRLGANIWQGWTNYAGYVAELGWWNIGLTAGEIKQLAKGALPKFVRPQSLQLYLPCRTPN